MVQKMAEGGWVCMEGKIIQGKTIKEWEKKYPLMSKIISTEEVFWTNSNYEKFTDAIS